MAIYMQYGPIKGDVASKGHEEWVELSSLQWGIGRSIDSSSGSSADREGSMPSVSEITATKDNDSSSLNLMRASLGLPPCDKGQDVEIDFVRSDAEPDAYIKIKLTNTLVSGWSVSSSGDRPSESLTLSFTKVEFTNLPAGADIKPTASDSCTYDLPTHTGG